MLDWVYPPLLQCESKTDVAACLVVSSVRLLATIPILVGLIAEFYLGGVLALLSRHPVVSLSSFMHEFAGRMHSPDRSPRDDPPTLGEAGAHVAAVVFIGLVALDFVTRASVRTVAFALPLVFLFVCLGPTIEFGTASAADEPAETDGSGVHEEIKQRYADGELTDVELEAELEDYWEGEILGEEEDDNNESSEGIPFAQSGPVTGDTVQITGGDNAPEAVVPLGHTLTAEDVNRLAVKRRLEEKDADSD